MIDLRSDTVTKPTKGMLQAMISAKLGDDVFGEDPTMNNFEQKMAVLFGKEAGLFVPSGTMSNQLCLRVLCRPGDEVIIDEKGHIFNYETGAAALLSAVQLRTLKGDKGKLTPELIKSAIRPKNDWDPFSRVIAIENTTNKGGGACYSRDELKAIRKIGDEHGLFVHMDGARIWNAIIATGIEASFYGEIADTITICFSKSLGAPVGSMMLGSKEHIRLARRYRKMWGGGMRQVGLLAAAAEYAVENHLPLLKEDHIKAKKFAEAVSKSPRFEIDLSSVESNIVLFNVKNETVDEVLKGLSDKGIGMVDFGPNTIRATFHFQISDDDLSVVMSEMS